jgi:hypothetical protein
MRARYLAGLYPLEEFTPLLRRPAGAVGMDRADRWIGLSDGGAGLEARLTENFPRVEVIILDFYHPAEKLTGLARRLYPEDEARAEGRRGQWRWTAQGRRRGGPGGGPERMGLAARAGLGEAVGELIGYLERHAHRMEYPNTWPRAGASAAGRWRARARRWSVNA